MQVIEVRTTRHVAGNDTLLALPAGGDKSTQRSDIRTAHALADQISD